MIATSPDNVAQWQEMAKRFDLDTALMSYISDPENTLAAGLGALPRSNDTVYDAHAVLVLRDGRVALSVVSDQPYMDIERLVGHAIPPAAMVLENDHSVGPMNM